VSKKRHEKKRGFIPVEGERLVPSPSGVLVADILGKLPAEQYFVIGAYPEVWQKAIQHRLQDAFVDNMLLTETTLMQYRTQLRVAINNTISLALKSGACALGLEAVLNDIECRDAGCVIISSDAGGSDKKKLLGNPVTAKYCYEFGTKQELGRLVHRRAQVYLSIKHGALSEKCSYFLRCNTRFTAHDAV
jgi:ribosomal protein L30E